MVVIEVPTMVNDRYETRRSGHEHISGTNVLGGDVIRINVLIGCGLFLANINKIKGSLN